MGLFGRILDIDLSAGTYRWAGLPDDLADTLIGGRGINVDLLYDQIEVGTQPLSPRNILTFSCGLLTGTAAPSSARLHVNALSPLSGLLGSSNVGGGFGAQLRACGIQQMIVRGRAPQPVYLWLDGDTIEIRDAKSLWGLDTWATQEQLKTSLGSSRFKSMTIGPGGENGVLFGCIVTDHDHAAGRTGMGTVMGSKNLKAIVIKEHPQGTFMQPTDDGQKAIQSYIRLMKNSPHYRELRKFGGAGYVQWADDLGILATRNFRDYHFEAAQQIDGKNLEKYITRKRGCARCPIQCKADLEFQSGKLKGRPAVRPEFEPMLALGSKCGLSDLTSLVYLDNLCTRLGIDNISAGSAIAFAMDLFERGILTPADTEGIDLTWGNAAAMETLIHQMCSGEGFGALLAGGVRRAAATIGRGAERYAAHVKGLELSGYHPDTIMATALGYAVASRGADFNDVYATMEYKRLPAAGSEEFGSPKAADLKSIHGKAALVRRSMIIGTVLDSLGLCKVPALCLICAYDLVAEAGLTAALTGRPLSVSHLFTAGERIVNLERMFNFKHGASAADDRLPAMFFEKDYNAGQEPSKPQEWMEPMTREFYDIMGWDETGRPGAGKLCELGITPIDFSPRPG
jgi:aldehyde:ferredoxin oxidoreductase